MNAVAKDLRVMKLNATLLVKSVVAVSSLVGRILPMRGGSSMFFFFPFCHVGGAEKVHAAIVNCFAEETPWVFFTKKSANQGFLSLFGKRARLVDVWPLLKYGYPFSVGIMAGFINRHSKPVVFGSNSLFYYLLVPYLKKETRCIDLIHAFGGGSEDFSLPVAGELDSRVTISRKTVADLQAQYLEYGLSASVADRIVLIENCVSIPDTYREKPRRAPLKLIYVGRGTEEKRVHLVGKIASRCHREGLPVEVVIVGDALNAVAEDDRSHCTFTGEISGQERLGQLYDDSDLLLITSSREGFPTVIMEGMARGVVPVSTDVGGIPAHVATGRTGWLVRGAQNEDDIVEEMCLIVASMCKERELLARMSRAAYDYARATFGGERFCSAYRSLLLGA